MGAVVGKGGWRGRAIVLIMICSKEIDDSIVGEIMGFSPFQAFAKLSGSYESLKGGFAYEALLDLTGSYCVCKRERER